MVTTAPVDPTSALSVRQAAQRLDVSESLIRIWLRDGRLRFVRTALGLLIDREDVERVAQARGRAPISANT